MADVRRSNVLGLRRACGVCGHRLPSDRPVYRQWARGIAGQNGVFTASGTLPGHKSCALFAVLSCPYLKHVKGLTVQGFGRHGVVLGNAQPPEDFLSFGYVDPVNETPCDSNLLTAYEQAVAAHNVDTSSRLHWMDDRPAEMKQLAALAHADAVNWPNLWAGAMEFTPGRRLAQL